MLGSTSVPSNNLTRTQVVCKSNNTELHEFAFIYDKNIVELKAGRAYLLNTKKQHGSFAMVDDIYHILMGIYVNPHNFRVVTDLLPNCIDHG